MGSRELRKDLNNLESGITEMMSKFEKKPYTEGWPEDKWKEEIEKYPIFMKDVPNDGQDLPPLLQGLQQIKYDSDENTPNELAQTYRIEGNFNFKNKLYQKALINYKEGLKQNCSDELKATLYNNCAAVNFELQNFRSALEESRKALSINPSYSKAIVRIPHCLLGLRRYDDCIQECEKLLLQNYDFKKIAEIRTLALIRKEDYELARRKELLTRHLNGKIEKELMKAVRDRHINIGPSGELKSMSQLKFPSGGEAIEMVSVDENGFLSWPVRFFYPECGVMETVKQFIEIESFFHHLSYMFSERPRWDVQGMYTVNSICLYYTNKYKQAVKISVDDTLLETIRRPDYMVYNGCPLFYGFIIDSEAEVAFVQNPLIGQSGEDSDSDGDENL